MKNPTAKRLISLALSISSLAFPLGGCGDELLDTSDYEVDKVRATPDISLPLAYGELVLNDLLEDSTYVRVYPDGLIYLTFEDTQDILDLRSFMFFPDRTFEEHIGMVPAVYPPSNDEVHRYSLHTSQNFDFSQVLSEIAFKETTAIELGLSFNPSGAYDVFEVEISMPTFTKDGVPLTARADASEPIVIPLADYVATLDGNEFPLSITLIEKPHESTESIVVPTVATVFTSFHDFDFRYIKGFFGEMGPIGISPQTVKTSAFHESLGDAKVSFANPQLTFSVISDIGLPVTLDFTPLEARKSGGQTLPIKFTVPNPVEILAPTTMGEIAQTDIGIANLGEIFDFVPEEIRYGVSITANKGLTEGVNFMHDTSKLSIGVHAELPLHGRLSDVMMTKTFEVDLADAQETEILSGSLRVRAENELPLDVFLQIYFADGAGVVSDSLFAGGFTNLIAASSVTASGELQEPGIVDHSITLNEQKLKRLFESEKIIVKGAVNTTREPSGEQNYVQFKAGYKINFALGFQAELKLESDL